MNQSAGNSIMLLPKAYSLLPQ